MPRMYSFEFAEKQGTDNRFYILSTDAKTGIIKSLSDLYLNEFLTTTCYDRQESDQ